MLEPKRLLDLPNAVNLRELGGYPTVDGRHIHYRKALRSGALALLTPADAQALADYGWRTDIDLRSASEVSGAPDVLAPSVTYHHLPVYPFADQPSLGHKVVRHLMALVDHRIDPMAETYLRMFTDTGANQTFAQVFALLLANDQPDQAVLFHCAAGKDRTGVAAMMLEGALGVPEPLIREDYLLTNVVFAAPTAQIESALRSPNSTLVDDMNAHAAEAQCYLAVQDLIAREYGGWSGYAKQALGLSAGELTDLRNLYLA
ncbi:tyrosine-protein phosphatase [Lacticaseibacillus absianus]|uniref:tyrosine-protein phosphatase n=1 Tax=Lacticaseibacillus absianus TaxID=2729623 RepID=UPI0015CA9814|nr:tyrosine-protein phosphatase [Lacticaseibacillus absianus]